MLPLDDVRILDFSFHLPGPLASLIFAESGAEVIKIERPGTGDEIRMIAPFSGGESVNFAMLNRGKKSVCIDLKDPSAFGALEPLIREADIVIEQFRPGVMDRLGFGYKAVMAVNPDIIYCSITGYGQTGPTRSKAGHDLTYCAETGILSLINDSDGRPTIPHVTIADIAGGSYPAVMNVLLALRRRDRTGQGAHIEVAMSRNLFALQYWAIAERAVHGRAPKASASLLTGGTARYSIYRASDGGHIAVAPIEDRFWLRFCDLIALPEDLRDDSADPDATRAAVTGILATRSSHEWEMILGDDCCCARVRDLDEVLSDEYSTTAGIGTRVVSLKNGQTVPSLPVPIASEFLNDNASISAPVLGADNRLLRAAE